MEGNASPGAIPITYHLSSPICASGACVFPKGSHGGSHGQARDRNVPARMGAALGSSSFLSKKYLEKHLRYK